MEVKNLKTLAREIADILGETHKSPRTRITLIVQLCGVEFAQEILRQTYEIEANGGMPTNQGDRRRTPGGVFFRLAKDQIMDAEIRAKIFPPITWKERKRQRQELQEKRAAQAARKKSQPGATNAGLDPAPAGRTVVDMPPEAEAQLQ